MQRAACGGAAHVVLAVLGSLVAARLGVAHQGGDKACVETLSLKWSQS